MKIIDCFMYFDEDHLLEIRLETLFKHVDKFVIVEANLDHAGNLKEPKFNINKFSKFRDKIHYIFLRISQLITNFTRKTGGHLGGERIYNEMHLQKATKIVI